MSQVGEPCLIHRDDEKSCSEVGDRVCYDEAGENVIPVEWREPTDSWERDRIDYWAYVDGVGEVVYVDMDEVFVTNQLPDSEWCEACLRRRELGTAARLARIERRRAREAMSAAYRRLLQVRED